jgi:hypothetical protein
MWHYWHIFLRSLPEAKDALARIVDFINISITNNPTHDENK